MAPPAGDGYTPDVGVSAGNTNITQHVVDSLAADQQQIANLGSEVSRAVGRENSIETTLNQKISLLESKDTTIESQIASITGGSSLSLSQVESNLSSSLSAAETTLNQKIDAKQATL